MGRFLSLCFHSALPGLCQKELACSTPGELGGVQESKLLSWSSCMWDREWGHLSCPCKHSWQVAKTGRSQEPPSPP